MIGIKDTVLDFCLERICKNQEIYKTAGAKKAINNLMGFARLEKLD